MPSKYYINEDLTTKKAKLLKRARQLRKDSYIWKIWTMNANIFYTLKQDDENETPKQIKTDTDIDDIRRTAESRNK